ncbi:hypothetical protein ABZ403_25275 [Micromonospora zamorensis]
MRTGWLTEPSGRVGDDRRRGGGPALNVYQSATAGDGNTFALEADT